MNWTIVNLFFSWRILIQYIINIKWLTIKYLPVRRHGLPLCGGIWVEVLWKWVTANCTFIRDKGFPMRPTAEKKMLQCLSCQCIYCSLLCIAIQMGKLTESIYWQSKFSLSVKRYCIVSVIISFTDNARIAYMHNTSRIFCHADQYSLMVN